ncbi:hypothetical protein M011DRAFT_225711 [Sporormia fimetaria CBS 119925]|uniref:Uncharacterized protein n=1 Tax=Sporormia fimetaria CBS 119925 TaxID=1340428 RepID=A0A6A6UYX5_9PLEO|nr:hypothetical protein M011DRAFT_225711 [Sporormia fimetaria CBS 119925]
MKHIPRSVSKAVSPEVNSFAELKTSGRVARGWATNPWRSILSVTWGPNRAHQTSRRQVPKRTLRNLPRDKQESDPKTYARLVAAGGTAFVSSSSESFFNAMRHVFTTSKRRTAFSNIVLDRPQSIPSHYISLRRAKHTKGRNPPLVMPEIRLELHYNWHPIIPIDVSLTTMP